MHIKRTIFPDEPSKGWTSITICAIVWLLTGVLLWFMIGNLFDLPLDPKEVPEAVRQDNFKIRLIRTLMMAVPEMIIIFISEHEHLKKMHNSVGYDAYRWHHPAVGLTVATCIIIPIACCFAATWGWVTVVSLVSTLLLIWLPRLMFKPWF